MRNIWKRMQRTGDAEALKTLALGIVAIGIILLGVKLTGGWELFDTLKGM